MMTQTTVLLSACLCERNKRKAIIFAINIVLCNCTHTIYLPSAVLSTNTTVGQGREVYVVTPFVDKRDIRENCGKDVVCDIDPAQWIARLFALEIKDSGFDLITDGSEYKCNIPKIEGSLFKIFAEPVTGAFEADIHIVLSVTTNNGFKARRTFYVKGTEVSTFLHSEPIILFHQSVIKAAQQVISDMRDAVTELMDDNFCVGKLEDNNIVKYFTVEELEM